MNWRGITLVYMSCIDITAAIVVTSLQSASLSQHTFCITEFSFSTSRNDHQHGAMMSHASHLYRNSGTEAVMEGSFIVLQGTQTTEMSMAPGLAPASVLTQCTVQAQQLQYSPKGCGVNSRTTRKRVLQARSDNTSVASAFAAQPFKQWMKVGTLSTTLCKWTRSFARSFSHHEKKRLKWALLPTSLHSDEQWPEYVYHNGISKRFNLLEQPSPSQI